MPLLLLDLHLSCTEASMGRDVDPSPATTGTVRTWQQVPPPSWWSPGPHSPGTSAPPQSPRPRGRAAAVYPRETSAQRCHWRCPGSGGDWGVPLPPLLSRPKDHLGEKLQTMQKPPPAKLSQWGWEWCYITLSPCVQDVLQMFNNPKVISFYIIGSRKKVLKITPLFFPMAIHFSLKGVLSTWNNNFKVLSHTFAI